MQVSHRRWHGPVHVDEARLVGVDDPRLTRLLEPVLFDDVARRLVFAGLPDRLAVALLLAVLPSHFVEVGGRRVVAGAARSLGRPAAAR